MFIYCIKLHYREYKDALKQQRAHDVPAIYRTKNLDDQATYKTEPNTPTHHATTSSLATSKSDPTPLNSVLSGAKHVFDDTTKRTQETTSPYKSIINYSPNHNGNQMEINNKNKYIQDYVKPKSPVKGKTGILSHDNVPGRNANGLSGNVSPRLYMNGAPNDNNVKGLNGMKTNRPTISWNKDVPVEKMTFTMRREIDKAREETDLINQLRNVTANFSYYYFFKL